jgi:hypothetical protein
MRLRTITNIALSICLGALASGCLSEAADAPVKTATAASPIGSSPCVYGTMDRVGNRIVGWAVDLCPDSPYVSPELFVHSGSNNGRRLIYYGNCQYWEFSHIWCSPNVYIAVNIDGVDYEGMYGFDVDPSAGGQIPWFGSQYIQTGFYQQDYVPFDHFFFFF